MPERMKGATRLLIWTAVALVLMLAPLGLPPFAAMTLLPRRSSSACSP